MSREAEKRPLTPEELRWRAAAWDLEKVKRNLKLQYILLGVWGALTVGWIVIAILEIDTFNWSTIIVLLTGYIGTIGGIVNNKRILAGKKPWGDI